MEKINIHKQYMPLITEVLVNFKGNADGLNHLITHGFPDGCSKCESDVGKIPYVGGLNIIHPNMIHPVWRFVVAMLFKEQDEEIWKDEMNMPETHRIIYVDSYNTKQNADDGDNND